MWSFLVVGTLVLVPVRGSNADGALLSRFTGPGVNAAFGVAIAPGGDFDQDGTGDLLVGAPLVGNPGGWGGVRSGRAGAVRHSRPGESRQDGCGMAVGAVGDIDGRGTPDVLVGAPLGATGIPEVPWRTYAKVFAGEDAAVLFDSGDMPSGSGYGSSVASLGDLDGDETPDFAVGRPEGTGIHDSPPGTVYVYSGEDGSLLHLLTGPANGDGFGTSIAALGDLDGDGVPEFAVGSPGFVRGKVLEAGRVAVFSGATFEEIRSWEGRGRGEGLGWSLAALAPPGPLARTLAVRSSGGRDGPDSVLLLDARTGRRLRRLKGGDRVGFGAKLAGMGDVDGDGFPDVAALSHTVGDPAAHDDTALVEVFSGAKGRLLFAYRGFPGDAFEMSLSRAGDRDGDGTEELVVGIPRRNEVAIFRLGADPVAGLVRVALQRPADGPDADAGGIIEFGPHAISRPFEVALNRLDEAAWFPPYLFLEAAPGSGSFIDLGYLRSMSSILSDWRFEGGVDAWDPPESLRFATLEDFAGCRVEVRDPFGAVLLRAILPVPGAQDFRGRADLAPPDPGAFSRARGTVRVVSSSRRGAVKVIVAARGLPEGPAYTTWCEDAPSAGTFTGLGPLERGRLLIDTARGDALPGAAPDGASLSGRILEVRDGGTVVLRCMLP